MNKLYILCTCLIFCICFSGCTQINFPSCSTESDILAAEFSFQTDGTTICNEYEIYPIVDECGLTYPQIISETISANKINAIIKEFAFSNLNRLLEDTSSADYDIDYTVTFQGAEYICILF